MEIPLGDTYYFLFTTRQFSTGAPFTLAGTPALSVYEENNLTQITTGVAVTADYDTVTGLNECSIVATTGNGYEVGKYYSVVITTGTVDSVSVVGEVVGHFRVVPAEDAGAGIRDVNVTHAGDSAVTAAAGVLAVNTTQVEGADATDQINAACDTAMTDYGALKPTTAGRTLDVTLTGEAGVDLDNVNGTLGAAEIAANAIGASQLATDAVTEIRDAIMAAVVEDDGPAASNIALDDAIAFILAYAAGQATGQATTAPIFKSPGGAENRISATTDGSGNRSAITLTAPT